MKRKKKRSRRYEWADRGREGREGGKRGTSERKRRSDGYKREGGKV